MQILPPPPCGATLEGEFLYWSPSYGPYYFVFNQPIVDTTTYYNFKTNSPDYRPAFRLNAQYAFNSCDFLEARFTYFNGGDKKNIDSPSPIFDIPFQTQFLSPNSASSHVSLRYYAADLTLHNFRFCQNNFQATLFEGLHYADFSLHNVTKAQSAFLGQEKEEVNTNHSQFWGVGPEIGAHMSYTLPFDCLDSFSFVGNVRGALLASRATLRQKQILRQSTPLSNKVASESIWEVVPVCDFKLGVDYVCRCDCFSAQFEIGYEFVWYHNAFLNSFISVFSPTKRNVSFQGPYASVGVSF